MEFDLEKTSTCRGATKGRSMSNIPVLSRFLSHAGGGDAIEIGCGTGSYMIYLNKEFGYRIDGLDYSDNMDYVRANL